MISKLLIISVRRKEKHIKIVVLLSIIEIFINIADRYMHRICRYHIFYKFLKNTFVYIKAMI